MEQNQKLKDLAAEIQAARDAISGEQIRKDFRIW